MAAGDVGLPTAACRCRVEVGLMMAASAATGDDPPETPPSATSSLGGGGANQLGDAAETAAVPVRSNEASRRSATAPAAILPNISLLRRCRLYVAADTAAKLLTS